MNIPILIAFLAFAAEDPRSEPAACCTVSAPGFDPLHFVANANPPAPGAVTGTVTGTISFEGEKPEMEKLEIVSEKAKGCVPEGKQVDDLDRSLVLGAGDGIANVVVTVEVKGAELKMPMEPIVLDQHGCRFDPHVMAIPAGATVEFKNSDGVSHNVHTYPSKNDAMNKTIGAGSKESQKLAKADRVEIKCDIHPWMNSWLIVTDTPHMAITGGDGLFSIPNLPPGEYEIEVWHEKLGKDKADVTVGADGSSSPVAFKMGAAKKKSRGRRR